MTIYSFPNHKRAKGVNSYKFSGHLKARTWRTGAGRSRTGCHRNCSCLSPHVNLVLQYWNLSLKRKCRTQLQSSCSITSSEKHHGGCGSGTQWFHRWDLRYSWRTSLAGPSLPQSLMTQEEHLTTFLAAPGNISTTLNITLHKYI